MTSARVADPLAAVGALPGVEAAVAEARAAVDRLRAARVLRRRSAAVSAESALRAARASAALAGSDAPLAAFAAAPADLDATCRGALRLSAGLGPLVGTWERAPLQVLARLHVLAAAEVLAPAELGRPSVAAGLDRAELSARLLRLSGLVAGGTAAPAVVLAAVVHGELLALRPFGWGSELVARAAARLTLVSRGLDPQALSVPEVGYAQCAGAYAAATTSYASGGADGLRDWLLFCAGAVVRGAVEGLAVCAALERAGA